MIRVLMSFSVTDNFLSSTVFKSIISGISREDGIDYFEIHIDGNEFDALKLDPIKEEVKTNE